MFRDIVDLNGLWKTFSIVAGFGHFSKNIYIVASQRGAGDTILNNLYWFSNSRDQRNEIAKKLQKKFEITKG